jgi:hypothetical protein
LTTFTIQISMLNYEIDYLFILLPHTHTHVPSVPELNKSKAYVILLVRPLFVCFRLV